MFAPGHAQNSRKHLVAMDFTKIFPREAEPYVFTFFCTLYLKHFHF